MKVKKAFQFTVQVNVNAKVKLCTSKLKRGRENKVDVQGNDNVNVDAKKI
jgi:hypothetical protein